MKHWDTPSEPADLLVASGAVPSKMEAKRLVRQGAVDLDGRVLQTGEKVTLGGGRSHILRVGKLRFVELVQP